MPNRRIDLDAARAARAAARAEAQNEKLTIVFAGEEFAAPAEMPAGFPELAVAGELADAFRLLLNFELEDADDTVPTPFDRFWSAGPTVDDLLELAEGLTDAYGFGGGLGNLSASGASSRSTT